jgi:hypothetical protein
LDIGLLLLVIRRRRLVLNRAAYLSLHTHW